MHFNFNQYLGLINNAAILLSMGLLYDMLIIRDSADPGPLRNIAGGIFAGLMGMAVMLTPWNYGPGVVFDTRTVLLCTTGLFFGPLPAVIAALATSLLRAFQGGAGIYMGIGTIVTSSAIGVAWRYFRRDILHRISLAELLAMGVLVHLVMLFLTVLLPEGLRMKVLASIALPTMLIYPVGTALFGKVLSLRFARKVADWKLEESEARYRGYVYNAPTGVFIADRKGAFILVNRAACAITGYSEDELLSMGIPDLLHPEAAFEGNAHFNQVVTAGHALFEQTFRHKDGSRRVWRVDAVKISDDRYMGFVTDITETILSRERISEALREKEILIKELYHRTKNNMQVIRSMLILQGSVSESPEVKNIVSEMDGRIMAMALVHQMLYQSGSLSFINLKDYVDNLARTAIRGMNADSGGIELALSIDDIPVNIDLAIPFGLIINEFLTNTMKYAFPGRTNGRVDILIQRVPPDTLRLVYRDNGVGPGPDFSQEGGKTVGIKSIRALVEHQLQGTITMNAAQGFESVITVRDVNFLERV